jgi:hypothetical protein
MNHGFAYDRHYLCLTVWYAGRTWEFFPVVQRRDGRYRFEKQAKLSKKL